MFQPFMKCFDIKHFKMFFEKKINKFLDILQIIISFLFFNDSHFVVLTGFYNSAVYFQ